MRHQFGGEGGVVAEFALLDQLVAGVVAVAGQLMVETAFGNQTVEDVVGKAVARTVFIGEADQAAGFVVMVAEGMAQRIGASGRQTVLAVFVGSGMAFAVGMGFQTTSKVGEGVSTVMPIWAANRTCAGCQSGILFHYCNNGFKRFFFRKIRFD